MEADDSELKERQENEFEALKSIFDINFRDIRGENMKWKVSDETLKVVPPEFLLKVHPENSTNGYTEVHVSIELRVKFCSRYPYNKPSLALESPTGLSDNNVADQKCNNLFLC